MSSYMARPQEKPGYCGEREGCHDDEEVASATGCGCFGRFCFGIWDEEGESQNYLLQDRGGVLVVDKNTWVLAKFKTLKELSEVVAGPKWKNFIRKNGKFCNPKKFKPMNQFQYSPESYALNFDGDREQEEAQDNNFLYSFSSRFASHALINDQQRRSSATV